MGEHERSRCRILRATGPEIALRLRPQPFLKMPATLRHAFNLN